MGNRQTPAPEAMMIPATPQWAIARLRNGRGRDSRNIVTNPLTFPATDVY